MFEMAGLPVPVVVCIIVEAVFPDGVRDISILMSSILHILMVGILSGSLSNGIPL